MHDVTFVLAIILTLGFLTAKIGQFFHLPSVTGYVCAGLIIGPVGFNLLDLKLLEGQLDHFTQIALMLIAFGIGEHLEIKRLRQSSRMLFTIGAAETISTFLSVSFGIYLISTFWSNDTSLFPDNLIIPLILGAIAVATAPGSTLHVMRESKSTGQLTSSLVQLVALNNASAIIIFGFALAFTKQLAGGNFSLSIITSLFGSAWEVISSLTLGVFTGLLIDGLIHRLKKSDEMLCGGLALLLLSGEIARLVNISPLLTGMAVGFTIVNRDRRDVRIFRLLNNFEPPIHVLFFTIAGAHLSLDSLITAGWLGTGYFLLRSIGKIGGARIGTQLINADPTLKNYVGITLIPQAGMAIGFSFLLGSDPHFSMYSGQLTSIVLVGVFLAELIGPAFTKFALRKAGESSSEIERQDTCELFSNIKNGNMVQLVPWTWDKLKVPATLEGSVIFGVSQKETVNGLARVASLLALQHKAIPTAISVLGSAEDKLNESKRNEIFGLAEQEIKSMGYTLKSKTIVANSVAEGIVNSARHNGAKSILIGYPLEHSANEYRNTVEHVANNAPCPVIIARFIGILHTERILVPIVHSWNLSTIEHCLCSLANVGQHQITLLRLLPPDTSPKRIKSSEEKLYSWASTNNLPNVSCVAKSVEARLECITEEANQHDLIIMATDDEHRLKKFFFGSLADDVARNCCRPMLIVNGGGNNSNEK